MKGYAAPPKGVGKTLKFSSTKGCQTSNYEKPTWAYVVTVTFQPIIYLFMSYFTQTYILGLTLYWCRYQCGYEPNMMIQTTLGLSSEVAYPH
jgi:hypothetical protein